MLDELELNRDALARIYRRHHVRSVSVFGPTARADLDAARRGSELLVEFHLSRVPSMEGVQEGELSAFFGSRHVDVATPAVLPNPHRSPQLRARSGSAVCGLKCRA